MILHDLAPISTRRIKTDEGFLIVPAKVAKVGVQTYNPALDFAPGELPDYVRDRDPSIPVRLLRPDREVFDQAALQSVANKPVTDGHPTGGAVTASNVRDLQVGFSRDIVTHDNEAVKAELIIQANDAIEKIEKEGVNQISLGYATDIQWTSGVHDTFGAYDGIQTDIRCNHIALVKNGRAGPEIRLSDAKLNGGKKMATRVVDEFTIEVSDQAGEAIDKLQRELKVAIGLAEETEAKLSDSIRKTESLKGELDAEKAKAKSVEDVDKLVEKRLALIDSARKLNSKVDPSGKSDRELRVEAVKSVNDSFDFVDKSDEYVEAVFETLVKSHKPSESKALGEDLAKLKDAVNVADEARSRMIAARRGVEA